MPFIYVTVESPVLGTAGWVPAAASMKISDAIGVGRDGSLISVPVDLQQAGRGIGVFIGTAVGATRLAAQSKIARRDGVFVSGADLVAAGRVTDWWFEQVIVAPEAISRDSFVRFWSALLEASSLASADRLAFRLPSSERREFACGAIVVQNGVRFLILEREACGALFREQRYRFVQTLLEGLYGQGERIEIPISSASLVSWFCSALKTEGRPYRIKYDSIQHSLFASFVIGPAEQAPFARCECACFVGKAIPLIKVSWSQPRWKPIVGSFVVSE